MITSHLVVYGGLFFASFAAATIFPFQSEAALVGLMLQKHYPWELLVVVASAGNVLGSLANWGLGRYLNHFRDRRWFPVRPEKLVRVENFYHRYGKWSLLLSWLPIIGDPITVVAGALREPLPMFLLFVTVAKTGRYLAVIAIMQGWV